MRGMTFTLEPGEMLKSSKKRSLANTIGDVLSSIGIGDLSNIDSFKLTPYATPNLCKPFSLSGK
jgi:hypothetical protein